MKNLSIAAAALALVLAAACGRNRSCDRVPSVRPDAERSHTVVG